MESTASSLTEFASGLMTRAPSAAKLVFLNCEFKDSPGGMALSADLWALVKWPFLPTTRQRMELLADEALVLIDWGREELASRGAFSMTADLIAPRGKAPRLFIHSELRRLLSGDDSYQSQHKRYVAEEPLLALVE